MTQRDGRGSVSDPLHEPSPQPTLSQRLGVLRNEGFVTTLREGKRIHYRIGDPDALQILQLLHRLDCSKG